MLVRAQTADLVNTVTNYQMPANDSGWNSIFLQDANPLPFSMYKHQPGSSYTGIIQAHPTGDIN